MISDFFCYSLITFMTCDVEFPQAVRAPLSQQGIAQFARPFNRTVKLVHPVTGRLSVGLRTIYLLNI